MFVKICGITRPEDAQAAVNAGANALGFVFWPESPRFIDPYRARAIVSMLPPFVAAVGVFVNQPAAYVKSVGSLAKLGAVQLHGDETIGYAADLGRPVLKAIPVGDGAPAVAEWPSHVTMLLDVHDPAKRGGTGRAVDWPAAAQVAATRRAILAGGLSPANVGEAIARVRPFGIDVSSGVERSPGVKDHERIEALFDAVQRAVAASDELRSRVRF
jgi:phosphoribosylanthranilate isomerase